MNDRLWRKFEFLILCALILVLPTYVNTNVQGPTIVPKVLLTTCFACLILFSWCLRRTVFPERFTFSFIPIAFILLALYLGFEVLRSEYQHRAFRSALYYLSPLALGLYAYSQVRSERQRALMIFLIILGSLPVTIYAILQSMGIEFIRWEQMVEERRRIGSFLGNPSYVGDYLAIILVLLLGRIATMKRKLLLIPTLGYAAAVLFVILKTQSRGPWLLILFGCVVFATLMYRARKEEALFVTKRLLVVSVVVFLIVAMIVGTVIRGDDFMKLAGRFRQGLYLHGVSVQMRLVLWETARRVWLDQPWFGLGIHNFGVEYLDRLHDLLVEYSGTYAVFQKKTQVVQSNYVHNDYLQVLAEWGTVGYALLTLLIISCVYPITCFIKAQGRQERSLSSNWAAFACVTALLCLALDGCYAFPLQLPTTRLLIFVLLGIMGGYEAEFNGRTVRVSSRLAAAVLLAILIVPLGYTLQVSYKIFRGQANMLKASVAGYRGNHESELKYLQEAYYDMPENGELLFNIGNAYFAMSDLQEAKRFYGESTPIFNNPSLLMNEALVDLEMRRYDQLEDKLDKLSVLAPNLPQIHYVLGMRHYLAGDLDEAVKEFRRELDQNPNSLKSNLYLGQSLVLLNRYREAESALKEAIRLGPRNMASHESLGDLYADHLHTPSQAVLEYTLALKVAEVTGNRRAAFRISRKLDKAKSLMSN